MQLDNPSSELHSTQKSEIHQVKHEDAKSDHIEPNAQKSEAKDAPKTPKVPFYKNRKFVLLSLAVVATILLVIILTIVIVGLAVRAQRIEGSGVIVNQDVILEEFDKVVVNVEANLDIEQSDTARLSVNTDDNIAAELAFETRGKTLYITRADPLMFSKKLVPTQGVNISLVIPNIEKLTINGAGEVELKNLDQEDIDIVVNGSATVVGSIDLQKFELIVNGSGDIDLAGKAVDFTLAINGSGKCNCADLETNDSKVKISGSGDVFITANDILDIKITGSGDVTYSGDPIQLVQKTTGSGTVTKE